MGTPGWSYTNDYWPGYVGFKYIAMIYGTLALLVFIGLVAYSYVRLAKKAYIKELEAGQTPGLKKAVRKQHDEEKKLDKAELENANVVSVIGFLNRLRSDETSSD